MTRNSTTADGKMPTDEVEVASAADALIAQAAGCRNRRAINFGIVMPDRTTPPTVPTTWRNLNLFGATFPRAEVDKARAWAIGAISAGHTPCVLFRKGGSGTVPQEMLDLLERPSAPAYDRTGRFPGSEEKTRMPKLHNEALVDETAEFIAAELIVLLDRKNTDSHMNRRIREACPAYRQGLTNGDRVLAALKALHLVGAELIRDMTSMTRDPTFEEMDEEEEREEIERELSLNPAIPPREGPRPQQ
jgi:hypothetical protein